MQGMGLGPTMGHVPLLDEIAIIAALAVVATVLLARVRLPTVAGLLAAGAWMGPFGLKLVRSVHDIEVLAEVGVVLLLFSIGLEFSLSRLRDVFKQVALGGAIQVVLTTLVATLVAMACGQPAGRGVFYGFVLALSSTAIVLRSLTERRELEAPHGRFIVGTLIFQDLCVVPMVLIVPLLGDAAQSHHIAADISIALLKAVVVVIGIVGISRLIVPRVLTWVDASRSREVFLLAILALCIGTAWLTSLAGLSLALGAFLGGMVVADTEFGHRAMGDILPLRDAFVSIFFVSLGMLFDIRVVLTQPLLVAALLFGFLFVKGMLATLSAMAMRFPARVAWLAGVGLAQFGEFGFVLTRLAQSHGVVDERAVSPLFAAGIASMFLAPLLLRVAPHITAGERLLAPLERLIGVRGIDAADEASDVHPVWEQHVVVVGYGIAGQLATRALSACGATCVVLDINVENVRQGKRDGVPIYYGDATSEEALGHARLSQARLFVLLIHDPIAAQRIVATVRRVAPHVAILTRTQFYRERDAVLSTGAHDVVAEEIEGTVEVVARMLRTLEVPRNMIDTRIQAIRTETTTSERKATVPRPLLNDVRGLDELKIESVAVLAGSRAAGRSPVELRLRSSTGALVVGVRRAGRLRANHDPHEAFEVGDVAYFVGTSDAIRLAMPWFDTHGGWTAAD
jgi:monovalent cation:H+ antiporter-2, CPA2 family